jgi:Type II secretory pathway, prepilin signal peptidase PulO and related peptidases
MEVFNSIVIFVLGITFGSFYNVVGFRLPKGKSIVKPASSCPNCKHMLKWYELIPILSFIIQGGKCRECKIKLSLFYPVIEFLTGALFATSYIMFGFTWEFVISLLIVSFFNIILVSDITYYIIPDEVTVVLSILVIITKIVMLDMKEVVISVIVGAILFIVMYSIMLFGNKIFKKETLGGGDIKLMFFIGLVLGFVEDGLVTIFLSSLLAFLPSLILLLKKKTHILPFGPFIVLAALIIFWLPIDVKEIFRVFGNIYGR